MREYGLLQAKGVVARGQFKSRVNGGGAWPEV